MGPRPDSADTETSVETVFRAISDLILNGEMKPGDIVNEAVLSKRFDVSRGPIREAMNRMLGLGLIEKQAYSRARVSGLSIRTVVEIFQLREALEGLIVRLVVENASDETIERLLQEFTDLTAEGKGTEFDIHIRLAEACGNDYVCRLFCGDLYYQLRRYRKLSGRQPGRSGNAKLEHWQILRAIRSRDAELAESLMRTHIRQATDSLSGMLAAEQEASKTNTENTQ